MQISNSLEPESYYHIYNRGINSFDLFTEEDNYDHFLDLYERYIHPIAETYAWVLMPNHFHFLVRIKNNICYKYNNTGRSNDNIRFEKVKGETTHLLVQKK